MGTKIAKARFWVGVCYNENMIDNWARDIGDILQIPYCYCIHDKDSLDKSEEQRKIHTHIIIVFTNTTTYNHACSVFNRLSAEGKKCLNTCEQIISIRNMYDYLIHNTETCKKKGKYLYDVKERITGNNFDIGAYEQISTLDKIRIKKEIAELIPQKRITNFYDMNEYIINYMDLEYYQVFIENQSYFNNLIKGYYNKIIAWLRHEDGEFNAYWNYQDIKSKKYIE